MGLTLPRIPIIRLASLYFHYCFLATKRWGTFMNANNPYSSCQQTFPESPAKMNEWISGICFCNVRLRHKIFFFSTGEELLTWFFNLKITSIFLSRHLFLESYHIISPQNITNPFLFLLHRSSLIYQFVFISWAAWWLGVFFQFTGSMCGNMTNLILGIYIFYFILKRKIITVSIFKQRHGFINTKTKRETATSWGRYAFSYLSDMTLSLLSSKLRQK